MSGVLAGSSNTLGRVGIYDCHVHSAVSADSEMPPQDAIARAQALGVGLCFTEHVDFECSSDKCFAADISQYLTDYEQYRSDTVLLGAEVGLTYNSRAASRKAVSDDRLDFIIGSVHIVRDYDLFMPEFYEQDLPWEDIYRQYFAFTIKVIEHCEYFDSLGHIDYISRYSRFDIKNVEYNTFRKEYDKIFEMLIDRGKVLELNTRRLGDPSAAKCLYSVYEGYYNRGGRYVTVGSDAHSTEVIGANFDIAADIAKRIGLNICYFKNRRLRV
ncbi:MAG: histidinol-phosphatase HisJ family protein [Clostridiales bacterium]|jgi:histidinol-phosphatase (PHP family)|nr:histidinol-phosphatase HisJ family protein [Clostridiales bacterium]